MKWRVWVLSATLAAGCFGDGVARIAAVTPDRGDAILATSITIVGKGFDCAVDEHFDARHAELGCEFTATLGDTPLANVQWVDTTLLLAEVPAGLSPGAYDLVVVRPDGQHLRLADAFTAGMVEVADCLPGDMRVASASELLTAFAMADATSGVERICVDATIDLTQTMDVADSIVLYGTSRGELRGGQLPVGALGLVLGGDASRVEHLRFSGFSAGALRALDGDLVVNDGRFDNASPAIVAGGAVDLLRCEFSGGAAALRVRDAHGAVVRVRQSVFRDVGRGVEVEDAASLTVDNNTFYAVASESVRAEEVDAVRIRNNIFQQFGGDALELSAAVMAEPATANALSPEVACSQCAFDATNPVVDCLFVDPEAGDFSLQSASPCIDQGVDVGLPFLGSKPDLGAIEER